MPPQQSWHMQTLWIHLKKKLEKETNFTAFGGHSVLSNGPLTSLPWHGHPKVGRYDLGVLLKKYFSMYLTQSISTDNASKNTQKKSLHKLSWLLIEGLEYEYKLSKPFQSKWVGKKWFEQSRNCFRERQGYNSISTSVTLSRGAWTWLSWLHPAWCCLRQ